MKVLVVVLAITAIMYIIFKLGQVDVRMQVAELLQGLTESYCGDSNDEKCFRNGARWIVGKLLEEPQDYEDVVHPDVDEITAAQISSVYDLLRSYSHNRSTDDMIKLCKELIGRLESKDLCNHPTDECEIIYGYIIMLFSDCWFENKNKQLVPLIVDQIAQRLQELTVAKEMEES